MPRFATTPLICHQVRDCFYFQAAATVAEKDHRNLDQIVFSLRDSCLAPLSFPTEEGTQEFENLTSQIYTVEHGRDEFTAFHETFSPNLFTRTDTSRVRNAVDVQ